MAVPRWFVLMVELLACADKNVTLNAVFVFRKGSEELHQMSLA